MAKGKWWSYRVVTFATSGDSLVRYASTKAEAIKALADAATQGRTGFVSAIYGLVCGEPFAKLGYVAEIVDSPGGVKKVKKS